MVAPRYRVDGHRIRRARETLGKTQHDIAAQVGISQPYLCAIETGYREPRVETLAAVCHAVGVPLDDVLVAQIEDAEAIASAGR